MQDILLTKVVLQIVVYFICFICSYAQDIGFENGYISNADRLFFLPAQIQLKPSHPSGNSASLS